MTGTAVYLYGVARGLDPDALGGAEGVAGTTVRGVVAGGLTALVSTVRLEDYGEAALRANLEDLAWLEATARAHHEVVDRAAHAAPTAPVRIATLYRDDARVAEVLTEEGARFGAVFDRITGRSEWGVKAYARAVPTTAAPTTAGPEPGHDPGGGLVSRAEPLTGTHAPTPAGAAGVGTAYLRRRQDERRRRAEAERRVAERAAAVHAELADHAVAARHHPAQDPRLSGRPDPQILNVSYLLDDEQAPGFEAVVRALAERMTDVEVEVTGPWPPYSFIDTGETTPPPGPRDAPR
ncbi:GvpL/GvpF family gas vesicle protein [Actinomadura roseirufa]|uniref:GvpL/GvpF family gas vesicle protein n=1 Tax=Actinomadura roseirufa TaxID=2094049 RepID=UPI001041A98F|nr:GvpL/GvpF family gas vesicle protein [Actinomadura roseirufa]